MSNFDHDAQFILFDAKGAKVLERSISQDNTIDTSTLASGTYMYRVISKSKMLNGVIIIK